MTNSSIPSLIVGFEAASPVMPLAHQKGMTVADNLARIRETIGDRPVTLIAVTKNAQPRQIEEAFEFGVTDFAESRIQDALGKRKSLPPQLVEAASWHFIGHLQSNKVKQAISSFSMIHSVDSLPLASEISRIASKQNAVQLVLLQVKMAPDPNKSGFHPDQLRREIGSLLALPAIKVRGLMTIAPLTSDRGVWIECFRGLSQLRDEFKRQHDIELKELSMGMSDDWQEAISCGATMVRLGRAIFGS